MLKKKQNTISPSYWNAAIQHLSHDSVMKNIIDNAPNTVLQRRSDPLSVLLRSIIAQQLSVKAADTIWNRILAHYKNKIKAKIILSTDIAVLCSLGLSRPKALYFYNIAEFVQKQKRNYFEKTSPEDIKKDLLDIKGVGEWTYNMFAIFYLLSPDIFPINDIAILRAIKINYELDLEKDLFLKKVWELSATWSPYNTVACWYLWQFLDAEPVNY